MSKLYIGIDPGRTGAYAITLEDGIPILYQPFSSYSDFSYELAALQKDNTVALVVLEQVSAMPGQGVSSMFTFGANYGGWLVALELLKLPHILVRPQVWQKAILGQIPKGESKPRALAYAQRKYPQMSLKKSNSGIVDALCLAEYGRRYG